MNRSCVLNLDDPRGTLALAGGKGRNLGIMRRAGLPVPDGLVVSTDAYRLFVASNQLGPTIAAAWDPGKGSEELESSSAALRAAFTAGVIPASLVDEISSAYLALGSPPVAVRSSATAEDLPEASFAGQQDTYLNIQGVPSVLDAVRRCWGSLWTARAMAYRARQGIPPEEVSLAVVIQRMAPATAAGVMFTVHPITGRTDRSVINATWGLGEALVAGRVNPDLLVVEKATGRLIREERGEKAVMTALSKEGTEEIAVTADRQGARAIQDGQAAALVALGLRLEQLFGGPQDVEWAVVGAEVVLLQSRAVTTGTSVPGDDAWAPTSRPSPQPFDFWTHQDMGERWPDPVTPLTWSICEPMNQIIMDRMLTGLKAPWVGQIQWTRRVFGHVYMNEGALLHAFTHGMGMPLAMVRSGLTHPAAAPRDADSWRFGKVLQSFSYFWAAATQWEKNVDRLEASFPQIDAWVDAFMARDLRSASDRDLLKEAQEVWFARILHYVAWHANATSLAMSSYSELENFLGSAGEDATLAQTLVGGLTGVLAAEMVPELAELAATLRRLDLALPQSAEALEALRADPRAASFFPQWERFLQRHGHRCMAEAELRFPRWSEAPEQVLQQVEAFLQNPAAGASTAPAAARRVEATDALRARLGWWQKMLFERALSRTHRYTRMRDNGQSYIVKLLLPLRVLYAELGRRWRRAGWLRSSDDLFFLVTEELEATAQRGEGPGLQARADARRLAYEHWFTQSPPEALDAEGEPVSAVIPAGDANTLVGVAASRGTVTGIARVILTPAEAGRLQPGEILVTRATDPRMDPRFSVIGGAVLEIGGLLSHGAIVAREYGLPAVVNVPNCTKKIVDGQRISVDGTTGRVSLMEG